MDTKEEAVQVPQAPAILPSAEAKKWKETYASALKQAQTDHPEDASAQTTAALREANRMLRVPEPKTAADVAKLASWQVLKKSVGEGVIRIVTCDGKKYEVPEKGGPSGDDGGKSDDTGNRGKKEEKKSA